MQTPLQILHLEDNPHDAELLRARLAGAGIAPTITRVKSKHDFESALRTRKFDLILSDHTLPGFSGLAALELALELAPDCPLIFISGTMGEEAAVDALKRGAVDYVLKDRPARLAEAVRRALREAAEKAQRRRAELEIRRSREQLRALAARLQAAREEERLRISREMHDGLGEMLTRMDVTLALMRPLLETPAGEAGPRAALEKIVELRGLISGTANLVRDLCTELRPAVLDDLGLVPALEWQAQQFQNRTGIRCELRLPEHVPLNNEQALTLFRIFQELLTNIARHSQASKMQLCLQSSGNEVIMEVRDNGVGMRLETGAETKSLGLLGMRERATLLGGAVEFAGRPGKGTVVTVRLPAAPVPK